MSDLFSAFQKVNKEEWKEQVMKDLKGKEHSILEFNDPIEEIQFDAYYHASDVKSNQEKPGNFPYKRGLNNTVNNWSNTQFVRIDDERKANESAKKLLMNGVNSIVFESKKDSTNWSIVLDEIQTQHITTQFNITSIAEYRRIIEVTGSNHLHQILFNIDLLDHDVDLKEFTSILSQGQHPVFVVNAVKIQEAGGISWQEISFALNAGHEYLLKLMETGLSIDQASACIHFHFGIGSNYFFETAKFRSFRSLWAKLINAYNPEHSCSHNTSVTGITTMMNKSLVDPYTNLLRQSTEAMSAINGGVNHLLVMPYDSCSNDQTNDIASRMAINISLILAEESYFNIVTDPTGGSYTLEVLTEKIGHRAWSEFQELEKAGGLMNAECLLQFKAQVNQKRIERMESFSNGKIIQIGTNKYPSPEPKANTWNNPTTYLGLEQLVYERELKVELNEKS